MERKRRSLGWVMLGVTIAAIGPLQARADRTRDPGIRIEIDRLRFRLEALDLRDRTSGPSFAVAVGSPAHPTPSGFFRARRLVLHPAWRPGRFARSLGAAAEAPSDTGPMGVAKIPFAQGGEVALHGGAHPFVLGKPISAGCVRATDADLLRLVAWLEDQGVLGPEVRTPDGEIVRRFVRRVEVHVR